MAKIMPIFCPCPETLCESEFKDDGPINLADKISRLHSIQVVEWALMAFFRQIYCENLEQKAEQKVLKILQFVPKISKFKVRAKEAVVAKETSTTKKKPSILYQVPSEHLRNFPDATPCRFKDEKCKLVLKRLCFGREHWALSSHRAT
ncbi:hypothetical protein H1C71_035162 [Ictidomys tridecemlineatus]|nr:hypothetical protein H1C71_035162 [Ictidomys tridecemlineatus]